MVAEIQVICSWYWACRRGGGASAGLGAEGVQQQGKLFMLAQSEGVLVGLVVSFCSCVCVLLGSLIDGCGSYDQCACVHPRTWVLR